MTARRYPNTVATVPLESVSLPLRPADRMVLSLPKHLTLRLGAEMLRCMTKMVTSLAVFFRARPNASPVTTSTDTWVSSYPLSATVNASTSTLVQPHSALQAKPLFRETTVSFPFRPLLSSRVMVISSMYESYDYSVYRFGFCAPEKV
jgi:hypothetical protein